MKYGYRASFLAVFILMSSACVNGLIYNKEVFDKAGFTDVYKRQIPDNALLRVKGHSRNNFAIKWIKKTKSYVELSSMYGLLRITQMCIRDRHHSCSL